MVEIIDRPGMKAQVKTLLRDAQVNPKAFVALYLAINLLLGLADSLANPGETITAANPLGMFVYILPSLVGSVLGAGFILYCMAVRRGERAEFLTLFDGFSFAGKVVGLAIVETFFIMLWSMLLVIPGIVAAYRYRFALTNLCQNPELGIMDALNMSKAQTVGYKGQLFMLDLSYFGWMLLASLPTGVLTWLETSAVMRGQEIAFPLHPAVWLAVCSLWQLAVSVFYLADYQCVELGYYETAQRTSGVWADSQVPPPRDEDHFDIF